MFYTNLKSNSYEVIKNGDNISIFVLKLKYIMSIQYVKNSYLILLPIFFYIYTHKQDNRYVKMKYV